MQIFCLTILRFSSSTVYDFSSDFFTLSFFICECLIAQLAVHLDQDREVNGSNPGVVKIFSTRLSFESNSSDFSRLIFLRR